MALDNETKSTEVPALKVDEDEKIKTEKQLQDEKLTEKIIVPMEEMNPKDVEPTVTEKTIPETVTKEDNESKDQETAKEVAEIIAKNVDDPVVVKEANPGVDPNMTDDEKEENDPIVCEPQPVPADEIAMKKDAETKEKKEEETRVECAKETIEPLKIEEPVSDVKKDDETTEKRNEKDNEKEKTDLEKPALEDVNTGSKEEKRVEEIKLTDSTPKEDENSTPKESYSFMGKMKKSFMKAKKAISGKSSNTPTTTTTTTTNKTPETKEDEKT